ncbi:hypothetical protein PIB30_039581 [Stylosanthes scabra]|uniref:Uncharacterized protein n=1 Tax=Stylosanthes scabra TaxID=79078 RepID=A0ABU6WEQ7_9FABA|nr:hypothetical protein [Stylosanthes scabra]
MLLDECMVAAEITNTEKAERFVEEEGSALMRVVLPSQGLGKFRIDEWSFRRIHLFDGKFNENFWRETKLAWRERFRRIIRRKIRRKLRDAKRTVSVIDELVSVGYIRQKIRRKLENKPRRRTPPPHLQNPLSPLSLSTQNPQNPNPPTAALPPHADVDADAASPGSEDDVAVVARGVSVRLSLSLSLSASLPSPLPTAPPPPTSSHRRSHRLPPPLNHHRSRFTAVAPCRHCRSLPLIRSSTPPPSLPEFAKQQHGAVATNDRCCYRIEKDVLWDGGHVVDTAAADLCK